MELKVKNKIYAEIFYEKMNILKLYESMIFDDVAVTAYYSYFAHQDTQILFEYEGLEFGIFPNGLEDVEKCLDLAVKLNILTRKQLNSAMDKGIKRGKSDIKKERIDINDK